MYIEIEIECGGSRNIDALLVSAGDYLLIDDDDLLLIS